MGGIDARRIFDGLWRMIMATVLMTVITWLILSLVDGLGVFGQLMVGGTVGAVSYIVASLAFGVKEIRQLATYGLERIRNRRTS
jgi:hypothetical protein